MACVNAACIGDGGCVEAIPVGTAGQVLTQTANGPAWASQGDDQTASEVVFTPFGAIAATTVQAAIVEVVTEICTLIAGCNLEALANVSDIAPTVSGQVLTWNGTSWAPNTPAAAFTCADLATCQIDALANVSSSAATVGQVLTWDGTNWINGDAVAFTCAALATCSINDLGDVQATAATLGQHLGFDGTTWINVDPFDPANLVAAAACAVPLTVVGGDSLLYSWADIDHTSVGADGAGPNNTPVNPLPTAVGTTTGYGAFQVQLTNPHPCRDMLVTIELNGYTTLYAYNEPSGAFLWYTMGWNFSIDGVPVIVSGGVDTNYGIAVNPGGIFIMEAATGSLTTHRTIAPGATIIVGMEGTVTAFNPATNPDTLSSASFGGGSISLTGTTV